MRIFVTGGAGFIGSCFVRSVLTDAFPALAGAHVSVFDKLTYAGNLTNLAPVVDSGRYAFVRGDICSADDLDAALPGHDVIVGVNAFYDAIDSQFGNQFNQFGFGAEVLTKYVDWRFNYYLPEDKEFELDRYNKREQSLEAEMAGQEQAWREIVAKHDLRPTELNEIASWWHTDGDLGRRVATFADMTKSRDRGFTAYQDSVRSFTDAFDRLRAAKVLP